MTTPTERNHEAPRNRRQEIVLHPKPRAMSTTKPPRRRLRAGYDPTLPCARCNHPTYTGGWCPKCGLYKSSRPKRHADEVELGARPTGYRLLEGAALVALAGDDTGPLCDVCGESRRNCHCQEGIW